MYNTNPISMYHTRACSTTAIVKRDYSRSHEQTRTCFQGKQGRAPKF